jgi:hypothetical protein
MTQKDYPQITQITQIFLLGLANAEPADNGGAKTSARRKRGNKSGRSRRVSMSRVVKDLVWKKLFFEFLIHSRRG